MARTILISMKKCGPGAVFLGILMLGPVECSAQSAAQIQLIDFESFTNASLSQSFSTGLTGRGGPVKWIVTEDTSAPAGTKVLAEISKDRTDYRFPVAIFEGLKAKDVSVRVSFKAVSGAMDQAAGVMVRVQDHNNYYVVRANALEDNVRLYRVVKGNREQFAGIDVSVPSQQWLELGITVEGDRFSILFNGKKIFEARDATFPGPGKVGLWSKADSVTYFDALSIQSRN